MPLKKQTGFQGRQTWLVKVEGVDSIEEAEQLRGQMLSMSAQERPQIDDEDEFYVQELIGMQVCTLGEDLLKTCKHAVQVSYLM